ncbi:protoporphyrinogen oxidase [Arthrospira platensis BEA 1257B]
MTNLVDSLIVGAGISGLSLAYSLNREKSVREPLKVLVTESQNRVGGNITTGRADDFLWEEGPNSFAPTPELLGLAVDLGLKEELIFADRKLPRYVYWNLMLHPVPMNPPALLSSELISARGKLRAALGAIGFVPPPVGAHLSQQGGEETITQFFDRHLGSEVLERLVQPFVSGVYAGDPQQLAVRSAFSRIVAAEEAGGGLLPGFVRSRLNKKAPVSTPDPNIPKTRPGELGSFRYGLQTLPETLASKLGDRVKLNWTIDRFYPTDHQTYIAEFSTPDGPQQVEARTLALMTPAHVSARLLQPLHSPIATALSQIPYPPVACVVLAYPKSALKQQLKGFGNLIPRHQGIRTLGTIWTSSLFPGRAPESWQVLSNYIGGATDPEIGEMDDDQIVAAVHQDLRQILLAEDVPPKVLAVHLWRRAIPQYTLGHQNRLNCIDAGLRSLPGLYLCSNYIDGVSVGDCVRRDKQWASKIQSHLHDCQTAN